MPELTVEASQVGDHRVLALAGHLDIDTVDELTTPAMTALVDRSIKTLSVDLAEVTFIDSTGIGALISLRATANDVGAQFVLRRPTPRVLAVLRMIKMDTTFTIEPPVARRPRPS
jgi:anti-anti-sigma factor